ncbi:CsiV family protein [Pseudomonas sp. sp1636]|uniref:CsiV family protein n=1 Tax=Pseudomonas sp. sp1636 TaxID=3036707 RepID=UPI0025A67CBB|nr:CsiV family protein [Pseudomonas sp. sp1636]MDM8347823.1 CsiV family protein [Pseudomonas sp. sp1636]
MRALHPLTLLSLILLPLLNAGAAFAEAMYQVEVIVFRQTTQALAAARPAPDDWAQGALPIDSSQERATTLNSEASKLTPANGYRVLLHKAWAQSIGANPSSVALSSGAEHFGHFPAEGTLSLKQDRLIDLNANLWVNQFDDSGALSSSELIKHGVRLQSGELTYLDHGSLGLLVRISPL